MAQQLKMGDSFPEYQLQTIAGQALVLPRDLKGEFSVIIFYRGGW